MGSRRPLPASPVIPLLAPFLNVESFNPDSRAGVFVGLAGLPYFISNCGRTFLGQSMW